MSLTPETQTNEQPPRPSRGVPVQQTHHQDAGFGRVPPAHSRPIVPITHGQGVVIIVLLAILLALSFWPTFKPTSRWEYKIEAVPDIGFETEMQSLGKEGWELVFARRASSGSDVNTKPEFSYEMIFKRPTK